LQHRPIDLLNVDAAVLHRLNQIGDLQQLARGGLMISEGAVANKLHAATLSSLLILAAHHDSSGRALLKRVARCYVARNVRCLDRSDLNYFSANVSASHHLGALGPKNHVSLATRKGWVEPNRHLARAGCIADLSDKNVPME
jgi:hypothetical protein